MDYGWNLEGEAFLWYLKVFALTDQFLYCPIIKIQIHFHFHFHAPYQIIMLYLSTRIYAYWPYKSHPVIWWLYLDLTEVFLHFSSYKGQAVFWAPFSGGSCEGNSGPQPVPRLSRSTKFTSKRVQMGGISAPSSRADEMIEHGTVPLFRTNSQVTSVWQWANFKIRSILRISNSYWGYYLEEQRAELCQAVFKLNNISRNCVVFEHE